MIEPRPRVILEIYRLWFLHGATRAELRAAVDRVTGRNQRGRPESKIYTPHLWAMCALVWVYGRDRFTAAKQILRLADRSVDQRDNQARALVRRFDESFKEGILSTTRERYARSSADARVGEFYMFWEYSGLSLPSDIKSATDWETEFRTLAMASNGWNDAALGNYVVALDKSIAASTFESGRH